MAGCGAQERTLWKNNKKNQNAFTTTQDIELMIKREEQCAIYFQLREQTNVWGSVISSKMHANVTNLLYFIKVVYWPRRRS